MVAPKKYSKRWDDMMVATCYTLKSGSYKISIFISFYADQFVFFFFLDITFFQCQVRVRVDELCSWDLRMFWQLTKIAYVKKPNVVGMSLFQIFLILVMLLLFHCLIILHGYYIHFKGYDSTKWQWVILLTSYFFVGFYRHSG